MSAIDVFGDKTLLNNARKLKSTMSIVYNAGTVVVNQMYDLDGYGEFLYHP